MIKTNRTRMVSGKPRPVYAMLTTVKMRRLIKCRTLEDVIDFCVDNEFHGYIAGTKHLLTFSGALQKASL